jgi:hypothetical protein
MKGSERGMSMDSKYLQLLKNQDFTLVAAGFEATEEGTLWRKDGVWFGREAALQRARKILHATTEEAKPEAC